jgi:hypothetical protein
MSQSVEGAGKTPRTAPAAPTGGAPIAPERWDQVADQWETTRRILRTMDSLELGETEPATLFTWGGEHP